MTQRVQFRRLFEAAPRLAFVAAVLATAATPGYAQETGQEINVFELRDVAVDVTAETAAAAREQALAQGERDAFDRLVRRLVLRHDWGRVPELEREALGALVQDFGVAEEKTSPVRYIARLDFRFHPQAARNLFQTYGLAFAETPSKPVLVLPIFRAGGRVVLWDGPNPWLDAWRELPLGDGLAPVLLPLGDLTDIAAVGPDQASQGDSEQLKIIAERYGANDVLVAIAERTAGEGVASGEVAISLTRYGATLDPQSLIQSFPVGGDDAERAFRLAAASVAMDVEEAWKRDNQLRFGRESAMAVTVPVGSLKDWLDVRQRLLRSAAMRQLEVVLIARNEVRIILHYLGDPDQLAVALEQSDLILSDQVGERVLRLAKAPSSP